MSEIISYFKYKFIFSNDNKENINDAQIYKDNKENIIIMNNEDNKDANNSNISDGLKSKNCLLLKLFNR